MRVELQVQDGAERRLLRVVRRALASEPGVSIECSYAPTTRLSVYGCDASQRVEARIWRAIETHERRRETRGARALRAWVGLGT